MIRHRTAPVRLRSLALICILFIFGFFYFWRGAKDSPSFPDVQKFQSSKDKLVEEESKDSTETSARGEENRDVEDAKEVGEQEFVDKANDDDGTKNCALLRRQVKPPRPDTVVLFDKVPTRTLDIESVLPQDQKASVGMSLVIANRTMFLQPMLESLFRSDVMQHDLTLFVWLNFPTNDSPAADFFANFDSPVRIIALADKHYSNHQIVIPRIRIYETMKLLSEESGCPFDFLLELHDDMLFFPQWFNALLPARFQYPCNISTMGCAIIMPFIIREKKDNTSMLSIDMAALEATANRIYKKNRILSRCYPVHPWLLNMTILSKLGYYDEKYAPQEVEDIDLYFRADKAGYKSAAVLSSFVYHQGELTRALVTK